MKKTLLLLFMASFGACKTSQQTSVNNTSQTVVDGKIWASLFQQNAAEYAALCYQAFNAAKLSLDKAIAQNTSKKPLAIITDIDETFLDNSPFAVHQALQGKDYENKAWKDWTGKGDAVALPGSLDFFNYAASKNITVFYITNRDEDERTGTLNNLKKLNFPQANNEQLLLRTGLSSKEPRRVAVSEKYDIVLLLGDNLSDFSALWDKKTAVERMQNVNAQSKLFGSKFIMLPNISYGGWEDAIYGNSYNLTPAQKDSAIKANLKGY